MSKPDVPFHELLEIFESVARVDQNYFLCNLSTAKVRRGATLMRLSGFPFIIVCY